jgi:two-component system, cell cycle sensor histidine kinase and response regulator CckA
VLSLNDAVEGMSTLLRRLIGEDIQLVWRPEAELGLVKIDPSQLDQIVANLCVNARDAIEKTGHIVIETHNVDIDSFSHRLYGGIAPGAYVLLSVSDDGCGMPQEVLDHMFEPFFTTKQLGKGTGLGLSTVYGIVKQNGGGVHVYSELGRGSTFNIYLPRQVGQADALQVEEPQEPSSLNRETILLVEDEESILQNTRRMLESLGYQVLATRLPEEALRIVGSAGGERQLFEGYGDRIDLLLTDVIMPDMSGPELANRLLVRYPDLKYLFMSGYTANLIAVQGGWTDKADFIQKPFTRNSLAQKVREILARK